MRCGVQASAFPQVQLSTSSTSFVRLTMDVCVCATVIGSRVPLRDASGSRPSARLFVVCIRSRLVCVALAPYLRMPAPGFRRETCSGCLLCRLCVVRFGLLVVSGLGVWLVRAWGPAPDLPGAACSLIEGRLRVGDLGRCSGRIDGDCVASREQVLVQRLWMCVVVGLFVQGPRPDWGRVWALV